MAENGPSAKWTSSDPGYVFAPPEGAPCRVDARLSGVEAGKCFYGELFGWTFREAEEGTAEGRKEGPCGRGRTALPSPRRPARRTAGCRGQGASFAPLQR
ncbi:hypothetical protein GCM10022384_18310 [Streptomyces marokkonensis]|uniref:Uncharacterized protein n=1 Tax=Streptomyces marokkonensis TaxID=324855 RepID=A0ABP7PKH4_9ACTN